MEFLLIIFGTPLLILFMSTVVALIDYIGSSITLRIQEKNNVRQWQEAFVKVYGRMPTATDLVAAKRDNIIEEVSVSRTLLQYPRNWIRLRYVFIGGIVAGIVVNFGNITSMILGTTRVALITGASLYMQYISVGAVLFAVFVGGPFFLCVGFKDKPKKHPKFDGIMAMLAIFAIGLALSVPFIGAQERAVTDNRTAELDQIQKNFGKKGDFDVYNADTNTLMYEYPFAKTENADNDGDELTLTITSNESIWNNSPDINSDPDTWTAALQDSANNDVDVRVALDDAGHADYDITQNLPIDTANFSDMHWSKHKLYGTLKIHNSKYPVYIKY